jgi:opacity protein-like surface antigen
MLRSTLLVILFAFSGVAIADDFKYTSASVGYTNAEFDIASGVDIEGDLIGISGSAAIGESFFGFASYAQGDIEDNFGLGISGDLDMGNIGFGYHMPLSETVDLITSLSYEFIEVSDAGGSEDENGLGFGVGMRFAATDNVEINGGINYVDYGTIFGDRTSLDAVFLYNFTENFTVSVGGEWGDDLTQYTVGGRYYFGE